MSEMSSLAFNSISEPRLRRLNEYDIIKYITY